MNRKSEKHAVYIVEHPDNFCLCYLVPLEEEEREFRWARTDGIWSERLGEISPGSTGVFDSTEARALVRRCSRPMLLVSDTETDYNLRFDYAERLLTSDGSNDKLFVPQNNYRGVGGASRI